MASRLSVSHRPPSCPDTDIEEPTRDFSFSSSLPTESSMSDIDSSPCLSEQASPTPLIPIPQSDPIANSPTATPPVSQLIGVHLPTSTPECSLTAVSPDAPPFSPLTRGVLPTSTPQASPTAVSPYAPPFSPLTRGVLPTSTPQGSPTAVSPYAPPFSPLTRGVLPTSTPQGSPTAVSPEAPPFSPLTGGVLPTSMPQVSPTVSHDAPTQTSAPECLLAAVSLDNPARTWYGFKLVGDNIDKNVRPRHQTLQRQTQSFHYFNSYAIKDRLDLSAMSDNPSTQDVEAIDVYTILPSAEDHEEILKNFAIIARRIIVKYIPAFEKIPGLTKEHISHCFCTEMSKQSKVVSCCNKSAYLQLTLIMWPHSQFFHFCERPGNEATDHVHKRNRCKCIYNTYLLSTGSFGHNHEE